jgi:deoxyribonuclease V
MKAWEKLEAKPDLVIADGIGIAHPRRMGIATHLGLILGIPTIGCAKSVLVGKYDEPDEIPGYVSNLVDPKTGEVIGAALRTKPRVKPVFVSPGHLITLQESVEIMRQCMGRYRIPEPTRLAHNAVNEYRVRDSGNQPEIPDGRG